MSKQQVAKSIADFFSEILEDKYRPLLDDSSTESVRFQFKRTILIEQTHLLPRYMILPSGVSYTVRSIAYGDSERFGMLGNNTLHVVFVYNDDSVDDLKKKFNYLRTYSEELRIVVCLEKR